MIIINTEIMCTKPIENLSRNAVYGGFCMKGRWIIATMGNSVKSTKPGASYYSTTANDYAEYTPKNLEPGWYDVSFWNIKYQTDQNPMKMSGTVYSNNKLTENIPLDVSTALNDRTGAWTKVGTYYFAGTDDEYFRLVAKGGGFARPSDVKFELNTEKTVLKKSKFKETFQLIHTTLGNCVFVHFYSPVIIHNGNESFSAEPGTCIIYKNSMPCYFESTDKNFKYDRMEIQDDITCLMEKAGLKYGMPYHIENTNFIADIIQKIKSEINENDLFKKELTDILVSELLFRISKEHNLKALPALTEALHNALTSIRKEILINYSDKWTVELMAKKAYMSTPYFYIMYKAKFGISPKKDLQKIRIEHAKIMLSQKKHTVREIATLIGYENEYYFIRKFKEITGTTPGKYNRKFK